MSELAPWRHSWFPIPRSPSPLPPLDTFDVSGIVQSRDEKVAEDGLEVSLEVEAPYSVPSSPNRTGILDDELIIFHHSETPDLDIYSKRESIISILPPSDIPPITLEPLRIAHGNEEHQAPWFLHWPVAPRPTRSMSAPPCSPPFRDTRTLRRHASVMSLSGITIERMSLDTGTRLILPSHEKSRRRRGGDMTFGWDDDDECIPVLLPSSPLISPLFGSPWSPSSPSSEDMSHNVPPLYARDPGLKRSLSLGTRSKRSSTVDRGETTFGIIQEEGQGLGLGGPTLPLFYNSPRRGQSIHGRSASQGGGPDSGAQTSFVPGPSSPIVSRPSTLIHRTSSSPYAQPENILPLGSFNPDDDDEDGRASSQQKGTPSRCPPSLDQSPTLPAHIPINQTDDPDTPSTTPDSPIITTPCDNPDPKERPVSRIHRRVSLLHTYRQPPPSLPPSLPPLAPLPAEPAAASSPSTDHNSVIEREGKEKHTLQSPFEILPDDLSEEKANNKRYSQQLDVSTVKRVPRPHSLMSLDQVQRVPPHDHLNHPLHHPFLHHKSNPSVPFSTRSASTLDNTATSGITSPQTSSLSAPSSHRQSKFTAFSGSSSSSTYSASDTSSIAGKYSGYNGHHWGFGEKPDISTVFEEDDRSDGEVEVDFSAAPKSSHDPDQRVEREGHLPLGPPIDYRKDTETEAPRGVNGHTQPGALPSTTGHFHRHNTSDLSTNTFVPRPGRSGTISSQASAHSGKSSKSVHPFASAINRPTSPPPLPRSKLQSARPKSPLLHDAFTMQQVHLAPVHQVTVSSSDDKDDEENCPVCCESLSFTFRLPGEKPHVVPECGHALHEECFSTVYGDIRPNDTRRNLGVCGVCRQPMRISDGASYKKSGRNKMAKLMGNKPGDSHHIASSEGRTPTSPELEADPRADDPLSDPLGMHSSSSRSLSSDGQAGIVVPSISIKAEHSSISRTRRTGKQAIIAVISVVVPPAGDRGKYAAKTRPAEFLSRGGSGDEPPHLPPSPRSASSHPTDVSIPPSARSLPPLHGPDPFAHVLTDLQNRVAGYATSGLDSLGQLRLFDLLSVRKGTLIREFHVYLFQDAIICIVEERKSAMRKIFSSSSSVRSSDSSHSAHGKGILKMKGRIYMKHVQRITDSSIPGELSLTIEMEDPSMESFILVFKDRGSHETWKRTLNSILEEAKSGRPIASREESNAKIAKLMGVCAPMPRSANSNKAFASPISQPSPSMGGINFDFTPQPSASSFGTSALTPQTPSGNGHLAFDAPLAPVHTPIDLVVILSLPAPSQTGSLPLKARLMRESLSFVLALMGTKDRISLVVCEMGSNGVVRRTPFLNTTRYDSRQRLESFVELVGQGHVDNDDFEVPVGRDEKQDVVTAMNTALDVVLQRKVKNPLSGMILISDTSENIKRAQMDLVNARLDAANTPVHAVGYGKGHDPSPLWMISNHTNGTYTFVREWYHLRDSLAGIVGGMMTIAMTNMKLHINCQDNEFKVLKVSGASQAIVSTGGKYADVELRELRHGETRELMVEMDFVDTPDDHRYSGEGSDESGGPSGTGHQSTQGSIHKSTSIGNLGLGLDNLSVVDANNMMYEDVLIDEIPVTEVDCSFHDPAAGRSVTRLAHPVLLTTAILPPNAPPSSTPADSIVVRRKMELLASDMITRALLIASRKNFTHATKIMKETKNIIEKIAENLQIQVSRVQGAKSRRDMQNIHAVHGLTAVGGDLDTLIDALEEQQDTFDRDMRNFAAQQAVVLRTQKSWTIRTPSERLYCTPEIRHFIQMSADWQGTK